MHGKQQLVSPLECSELELNHSPKLETLCFPELEEEDGRSLAEHCRPDSSTETEGLQTTASFSENGNAHCNKIEMVHFAVLRWVISLRIVFFVSEKTRIWNESISQNASSLSNSKHWFTTSSLHPVAKTNMQIHPYT